MGRMKTIDDFCGPRKDCCRLLNLNLTGRKTMRRSSYLLLPAILLFCAIQPHGLMAAGITVTSRPVDTRVVSNLFAAYDAGDGFTGADGRRTLLRLRDGVSVRVAKTNEPGAQLAAVTGQGS